VRGENGVIPIYIRARAQFSAVSYRTGLYKRYLMPSRKARQMAEIYEITCAVPIVSGYVFGRGEWRIY
jgi:hypothetical protein